MRVPSSDLQNRMCCCSTLPDREKTPKPYAVLNPGQGEVSIPIVVDGERCTPHALADPPDPFHLIRPM